MSTLTQPNGRSRLIAIIGDPVKYLEAPTTLSRTYAVRGENAICIPIEVAAGALESVMAGLSETANVDGICVTKPHKFTATAYCSTLSETSRLIGAVSVLRRNPDGTWHGDTTDGVSFVKAQRDNGAIIDGARVLLIGAGGAGSAIGIELVHQGVSAVVVSDPDEARATALRDLLLGLGGAEISVGAADPTGFDVVCNATPLGMNEGDLPPFDLSLLDASMFVGDVIAGHGETKLIAAARAAGCGTATGTDMVNAVQEIMADYFVLGADE